MRTNRKVLGTALLIALISIGFYEAHAIAQVASSVLYKLKTVTASSMAGERLVRSEYVLNPTSTFSVNSDGNLAAIRGAITVSSGKTFGGGYLFGSQGKIIFDGATLSPAAAGDHIAGVYAQMSGSGATVSSGHVAVIIASGQNLPTGVDMIYAESGGNSINSILKAYVKSDYVFDIAGEAAFAKSTSGTGAGQCGQNGLAATKAIAVRVDSTNYWIPLCTAL